MMVKGQSMEEQTGVTQMFMRAYNSRVHVTNYWESVLKYFIDQESLNRLYKTKMVKDLDIAISPEECSAINTHLDVDHTFTVGESFVGRTL